VSRAAKPVHFQRHQPFGGETDHLVKKIRVRGLFNEGPKRNPVIGHRVVSLIGLVSL